jgi:hypothetical protein
MEGPPQGGPSSLSGSNGRNNGVEEGKVIDLGAKRCPTCGVAKGETHLDGCSRSPQNMRRLVQIRQDKIARGESVARGGRRRKLRMTEAELEAFKLESAGQMLYGDRATALEVLRRQLKSKDEKVAQNAAKLILAYTDGTPVAKIEQTTDQHTEVVYRSAALRYEDEHEQPALAAGDAS